MSLHTLFVVIPQEATEAAGISEILPSGVEKQISTQFRQQGDTAILSEGYKSTEYDTVYFRVE